MMQFETVKAAIVSILGAAEAGRFRTIGHPSQAQGAETIKGLNRTARVYFAQGEFPKNSGSLNGPVVHDISFAVELAASEPTKLDLTVLDNPASTEAQKTAALAAAKEGDLLADASFDELARIVYQILMDARNIDYGLTNQVANRWVSSIKKDSIGRQGGLITVTGTLSLNLRVEEQLTGDETGLPIEQIDTSLAIENNAAIAGTTNTYP